MNILQTKIKETLSNAPKGVHSIIYGFKTKDNKITNIKSLIYLVENKIPLSGIPLDQRIPEKLNIDNKEYLTDVVQSDVFRLNQCYDFTDPEVLALRSRVRPLSGGIEITALSMWEQINNDNNFTFYVGTLGFLAIDNTDNKLVGVTNNHVLVKDAFVNNEKSNNSTSSSIIDDFVFFDGNSYVGIPNLVLQFGTVNTSVNLEYDYIGYPKRYVPISENGTNTVDGALFTIKSSITDQSSSSQSQLSGSYAMPFATTTEIENLSSNETSIYSVGRTTGPKGENCPLVIFGIGSVDIYFNKQNVETVVTFSNTLFYKFADDSNLPVFSGDSGSALIADIDGSKKIAGLVFAGNGNRDVNNPISTIGAACRIDEVAEQLNISPWDGSNIDTSSDLPDYSYILTPLTDTRTSIVSGDKTFYLAGTVLTSEEDTQI